MDDKTLTAARLVIAASQAIHDFEVAAPAHDETLDAALTAIVDALFAVMELAGDANMTAEGAHEVIARQARRGI